jgi:hypothetical protein
MKTAAIAFWGMLFIFFAAGSSPADERPAACITCHAFLGGDLARPFQEWNNSIHRRNGITCDLCHCEGCHQDTSGFDRIDPMNVSAATIHELSRIRISLAEKKTKGAMPPLVADLPEDLDPSVIGLLAFAAVLVLFVIGHVIYLSLERRNDHEHRRP